MHGELGSAPLTVSVFGGEPARPLSASALRVLLTCPHRFLLERMLGFRPRIEPAETHRIDALSYGALFHKVAEVFARVHGAEFGARTHDLEHWRAVSDDAACTELDAFLRTYPLIGASVIDAERRRLRGDVRTFIDDDWNEGRPRRFVAAEREFGKDTAVAIPTSAGPLFVTGRIDRIDVEDTTTVGRDLKTGRARPREGQQIDPDVDLDLQLAVYVAVAEALAAEWSLPTEIVCAYVYVDPLAARSRAVVSLRSPMRCTMRGARWFDLAKSLIRDQTYVQTPDPNDCRWCPFSAICGDDAHGTNERLVDAIGSARQVSGSQGMSALLDAHDRQRAIGERERNVIVDASAGTGKTSLVVERLVELVAPTDGRAPIPIDRLAAITFTRKAAGELRVRTRQRILEKLATLPTGLAAWRSRCYEHSVASTPRISGRSTDSPIACSGSGQRKRASIRTTSSSR